MKSSRIKEYYNILYKIRKILLLLSIIFISGCSLSISDEDFITMTNIYEGNCLSSDEERYYYRSQSDQYYLYSSDFNGNNSIKLVEAVPGAIYVKDEWVYFENLSDNEKLYRVRADGGNLQKITDIKMKNIILYEKYFYYISENNLLCRMEMEHWQPQILNNTEISFFITDGSNFALLSERWVDNNLFKDIIICSMEGMEKKYLCDFTYLQRFYLDSNYLYYEDVNHSIQRICWNMKENDLQAEFISDVEGRWTLFKDYIYLCEKGNVSILHLKDRKKEPLFEIPYDIKLFYLINNEILIQYVDSDSSQYGRLWYRYDKELNECVLIEKLPYLPNIICSMDDPSEMFSYGTKVDIAEEYLDEEIIYHYEKEILSDNYDTGIGHPDCIDIKFPQFNSKVKSAEIINTKLKKLLEKEKKIGEEIVFSSDKRESQENKTYEAYAYYVYVNDEYVCIQYICRKTEDKFRYRDRYTLLYSTETGEQLDIKDILLKNNRKYRDILTFTISKYLEANEVDKIWLSQYVGEDALRGYTIEKGLKEESFFLTENGLVVVFEYTFNSREATTFEISYEFLESVGIW